MENVRSPRVLFRDSPVHTKNARHVTNVRTGSVSPSPAEAVYRTPAIFVTAHTRNNLRGCGGRAVRAVAQPLRCQAVARGHAMTRDRKAHNARREEVMSLVTYLRTLARDDEGQD